MIFFSKETSGFYNTKVHGVNMPDDAVEITEERYNALLAGQSEGQMITGDNSGVPGLIDRPSSPPTNAMNIAIIERTITAGDIRRALLGDQPALAKIQAVENQIDALSTAAENNKSNT